MAVEKIPPISPLGSPPRKKRRASRSPRLRHATICVKCDGSMRAGDLFFRNGRGQIMHPGCAPGSDD